MNNQFIIDYITSNGGVIKEYDLLRHIDKEQPQFFQSLGEKPSLYKRHFYCLHHLYLLRKSLAKYEQTIIISALEIRIIKNQSNTNEVGSLDHLADFYLNFENIKLSEKEVSEMLDQFWKKYSAIDQKSEALKVFGLAQNAIITKERIKQQYTKLVSVHHPDKGGEQEKFIQIKQAYNQLKHLF